jgi:hypothetical protein
MRVGCLRALVLRFLNNQRMSADVTSIIAIVVNGASPYWQVVTRRQGGAVTAVAAIQAFPTYQDRVGSLHITACNRGRSPVIVNTGLRLPDGWRSMRTGLGDRGGPS